MGYVAGKVKPLGLLGVILAMVHIADVIEQFANIKLRSTLVMLGHRAQKRLNGDYQHTQRHLNGQLH